MFLGDDNVLHCEGTIARRDVDLRTIFDGRVDSDKAVNIKMEESAFLGGLASEYSSATLLVAGHKLVRS